ncbi:MAG TPA: hypothetical protein VJP83_03140 [Terriglobales bacterium]|nr:hypothetical protein [Terriglobales bacterium]
MTAMEKPWKRRLIDADKNRSLVVTKELLDHSRIFLKLDLAYLVAAGAVFTGLKLEIDDVLINFGPFAVIPFVFSALVLVDGAIYSGLYALWADLVAWPSERRGGNR